MTKLDIEVIRKRAEAATKFKTAPHPHWYEKQSYEKLCEDIPALLAEIERLREQEEAYERCVKVALSRQTFIGELQTENEEMRIRCENTDQSAEAVEADNEYLRVEVERLRGMINDLDRFSTDHLVYELMRRDEEMEAERE